MASDTLAPPAQASGSAPVGAAGRGASRLATVLAGVRVAGETVRPFFGTFRPVAWVLIAATVVLWVAGFALGWDELAVTAYVIAATLVVCAFFVFGRTAYDITLDLNRTRVVVGERAVGAMTIANPAGRAILPSRVVLPVGNGRGDFAVPRLAPGASVEEVFAIPTAKRAVLAVGPVSVVRGDPLGLFERVHRTDDPVDLYVHPRTVSFDGQSLGFFRDLEGLTSRDLASDDVSFHALREYQAGDDLRHVHWKSTARTGSVMVRQYEQTRRSHFVIALSCTPAEYRDADEFELAISIAGSLGLRAVRDSRQVELRTPGRSLPADSAKRLLDSLSALEPSPPRRGGILELAGAVAVNLAEASVAVLVTGSRTDASTLRAACARLPFGARVLAIVADAGAAASLRRVADADVVTVGSLDGLPSALRRVLS